MRKKRKSNTVRSDTSIKKRRAATKKALIQKRKGAAPKTRNFNTLSEGEFFQRIRSSLRRAFRFWKPMLKALERASRPYKGPNKRQKIEYQCNHCKEWFPRTQVQIDHIQECGSLNTYADIVPFIQRLTIENIEGFQILCKPCHKVKTTDYKNQKKKK